MWRTLDHTADVALEVTAPSWPGLLEEAARAFGEWLSGGRLPPTPHETERVVTAQGVDRVELWVHAWRALHRLWAVEGFLAAQARVELDPSGLAARMRVGCVSAGALDPAHCLDVKAVTWHDARVAQETGGGETRWTGTIVLDL
ncbi:MAG TPA: archease [Planctomycetota bacterium]